MAIYLALGDSISIDDYTRVPGRGAASQLARQVGLHLGDLTRGFENLAPERAFLLADLERLFRGHGITSNEPWFVQVIEPNLAGASAIAEHWHELLTSQ